MLDFYVNPIEKELYSASIYNNGTFMDVINISVYMLNLPRKLSEILDIE